MTAEPQSFAFLLLCKDLLLGSKVMATARAVGVAVKQVRSVDALNANESAAARLIADFNELGFLDAAVAWKQRTGGSVMGFAGHADVAAFEHARAGNIDRTLARGAFVAQLEAILKSDDLRL